MHYGNVEFLNNYSDEINGGYYWLDNITKGEKIQKPIDPMRDGYDFKGWYIDQDCVTEWNFDNEKLLEDDVVLKLYAKWQ